MNRAQRRFVGAVLFALAIALHMTMMKWAYTSRHQRIPREEPLFMINADRVYDSTSRRSDEPFSFSLVEYADPMDMEMRRSLGNNFSSETWTFGLYLRRGFEASVLLGIAAPLLLLAVVGAVLLGGKRNKEQGKES